MITGYNDVFGRTVSGGFGTATSGQAYTVLGTTKDALQNFAKRNGWPIGRRGEKR